MTKHKIILDCDPGHDDAMAMILAHGNPDIEVLAVTTVAGNQTLQKVTQNALSIATMIGMTDVPIAAGCYRPLVNEIEIAPDIHGETGLDGADLPTPTIELDSRHAVDLIIDIVMREPAGTVTLVPTGALTNIAMAVRKEPRIIERVKEVVLMGGGYHEGNWSAVAEFNIYIDPEAAHIVFNEPWNIVMVGLDLTHQALATPDVIQTITEIGTPSAKIMADLLEFFKITYKEAQGFDAPPVHDPCTIAYLIDPTIVATQKVPVDIEMEGKLTKGMTVADFRRPAPQDCHTSVATKLDKDRFWNLIYDAMRRIG